MLKRGSKQKTKASPTTLTATFLSNVQQTAFDGETANFIKSFSDPMVIERVRCQIKHAHVFKLPPRQQASVGWRGADWKEKVWQGSVKVVDRKVDDTDMTAVLLVERQKGENGINGEKTKIFAVCPIKEGAVERCVDSSRYFVLRIENQSGRHMFIGVAFNERNDAFDFNTSLEDARREKEFEFQSQENSGENEVYALPTTDYSLKEGQKIHVAIPKSKKTNSDFALQGGTKAFANFQLDSPDSTETTEKPTKSKISAAKVNIKSSSVFGNQGNKKSGGFLLRPSSKDTPTRR